VHNTTSAVYAAHVHLQPKNNTLTKAPCPHQAQNTEEHKPARTGAFHVAGSRQHCSRPKGLPCLPLSAPPASSAVARPLPQPHQDRTQTQLQHLCCCLQGLQQHCDSPGSARQQQTPWAPEPGSTATWQDQTPQGSCVPGPNHPQLHLHPHHHYRCCRTTHCLVLGLAADCHSCRAAAAAAAASGCERCCCWPAAVLPQCGLPAAACPCAAPQPCLHLQLLLEQHPWQQHQQWGCCRSRAVAVLQPAPPTHPLRQHCCCCCHQPLKQAGLLHLIPDASQPSAAVCWQACAPCWRASVAVCHHVG